MGVRRVRAQSSAAGAPSLFLPSWSSTGERLSHSLVGTTSGNDGAPFAITGDGPLMHEEVLQAVLRDYPDRSGLGGVWHHCLSANTKWESQPQSSRQERCPSHFQELPAGWGCPQLNAVSPKKGRAFTWCYWPNCRFGAWSPFTPCTERKQTTELSLSSGQLPGWTPQQGRAQHLACCRKQSPASMAPASGEIQGASCAWPTSSDKHSDSGNPWFSIY